MCLCEFLSLTPKTFFEPLLLQYADRMDGQVKSLACLRLFPFAFSRPFVILSNASGKLEKIDCDK